MRGIDSSSPSSHFTHGNWLTLLSSLLLLIPVSASGQLTQPDSVADLGRVHSEMVWPIFGRVTSLRGEPILGAKVTIDLAGGAGPPQVLRTNALGEFKAEYKLDATRFTTVHAQVVVIKEGFRDARESADFQSKDSATREIVVVLQPENESSGTLSLPGLIGGLEGRFRSPAVRESVPESARKDFLEGADELFDQRKYPSAVNSLTKAVNRETACVNCRLLLCLSQIAAGSLTGARQQLTELDKLTSQGSAPAGRATMLLIAGVIDTWRGENKNALGLFTQAAELQPSDPAALQELGRALIFEKNWEAADQYLEKAVLNGAGLEARLLRIRALLELGDTEIADTEMQAYLGKRNPRELTGQARMTYLDLRQRIDLKSLSEVKSIVNQPWEELVKTVPELQGITTASSQDELPALLRKVGERVESFFNDFPNTVSLEEIHVESLGANGKARETASEKSNYLLLAKPQEWGLGITEYRVDLGSKSAAPAKLAGGSMRTKGFASASSIFHPRCQSGAEFRYLGRQTVDGRETIALGFAQQPERAKMTGLFIVNGVSEPELTQGIAWVDAQNYQIIRMRTGLLAPLRKVRLTRQTTEIQYAEVHFKDKAEAVWLPQVVTVTVQWKGRTFRNSHHYSEFRQFNVATEEHRKQASSGADANTQVN